MKIKVICDNSIFDIDNYLSHNDKVMTKTENSEIFKSNFYIYA